MHTGISLKQKLSDSGILPLFYHDDLPVCINITRALYDAGIRQLEFTNRGEHALQNFKGLIKEKEHSMPGLEIGVGTIKHAEDARKFIDAGAAFLVSPVVEPSVAEICQQVNMDWIPGCMTPTEIHHAEKLGARLIKLFPGNVLGPGFVEAVKVLFPASSFIVTGGVDATKENIHSWLKAGVVAVGMGSKLVSMELLAAKDYDGLKELTRKVLEIISSFHKK